jgi:formiminotetrahydrofolate cyclodeaminase
MTMEEGAMDPLDTSISEVLAATGRQSPELGGGAASILAGLIGLSLLRMAVATTGERAGHPMRGELDRLDGLRKELEGLARTDVAVFGRYVSALQLPHETDRQKEQRNEVLRDRGQEAAETPLRAASLIADALQLAAEMAPGTHREVTSDVYAGASILKGALIGAIATLDINLRPTRMEAERPAMLTRREAILERQRDALSAIERQAQADGYLFG